MTNNYDAHDLDAQYPPPATVPEGSAGELETSLRHAVQSARRLATKYEHLANYHANMARTLELLITQSEQNK